MTDRRYSLNKSRPTRLASLNGLDEFSLHFCMSDAFHVCVHSLYICFAYFCKKRNLFSKDAKTFQWHQAHSTGPKYLSTGNDISNAFSASATLGHSYHRLNRHDGKCSCLRYASLPFIILAYLGTK